MIPTLSPTRQRDRRRPFRIAVGVAALALGLTACGGGPGDEEDLVIALTKNDTFTEAEARCIAGAVFDEYGEDEEALGRISGAPDYEALNGTEGVAGFDAFFTRTVGVCTNT